MQKMQKFLQKFLEKYKKMQKSGKTIGFTVKNFTKEQKPLEKLWFFEKKGLKKGPATDSGRETPILVWICYEEPLQPSCLDNLFKKKNMPAKL